MYTDTIDCMGLYEIYVYIAHTLCTEYSYTAYSQMLNHIMRKLDWKSGLHGIAFKKEKVFWESYKLTSLNGIYERRSEIY